MIKKYDDEAGSNVFVTGEGAAGTEEATDEQTLSPPLKWAGGKRWLVATLLEILQAHLHRRLVEPFCGALSVALGLNPESALLNDSNPHLVNFHRWVAQGMVIELDMQNDANVYYEYRDEFNRLRVTDDEETQRAAELLYYLNRSCFNGLYRVNSSGQFNVPFGKYKTINYMRDFSIYAPVLSRWDFYCGDFENLALDAEDLVYADPPYDTEFTKYAKEDFVWRDQVRLAEWLANHPGPVVASNQATPRILDLYASLGFVVETLEAPRRISCKGDRTPALEMLASKGVY